MAAPEGRGPRFQARLLINREYNIGKNDKQGIFETGMPESGHGAGLPCLLTVEFFSSVFRVIPYPSVVYSQKNDGSFACKRFRLDSTRSGCIRIEAPRDPAAR
jgi:hypothetical protein